MQNQKRIRDHMMNVTDWDEFGSLPSPLKLSQIGRNIFLPPQSAFVSKAQASIGCTTESEWLVAPHVSIEHAEYNGWWLMPEESTVYFFFKLDINISGTILCKGCGTPTTRPIEISIRTPLAYGQHTILLVMPFKVKLFINAIRAAVAGGKLVKFLSENNEIMAYLLKFLEPMLLLVRNSAALLCASQLDANGLQQKIQKYIDDNTKWVGPLDEV